jgi:hypothetical protein
MTTKNHRFVPAGEVCDIETESKLVIELFRSNKFTGDHEGINGFRPAKVLKGDVPKDSIPVWTFQTSGAKVFEFGELIEYGDEYVIVIRDKFSISKIVRVNDLDHSATAILKGKMVTIGGSSIEELLDIKLAVAQELGIDYWKSPEEEEILKKRTAIAREAMKKLNEAQVIAKAEARAKHEIFKANILARSTIEAWSLKGQKFFGIPVTSDDEWKCLPDGKYCIMVKDGKPIEAFIVEKKGSRLGRIRVTEVLEEMPKQNVSMRLMDEMPEALDQVKVTIRGETRQILVFEDMTSLKQLQAAGLNSGTWVGINPKADKPMAVYAIRKDGIDTVGNVAKQQA